MYWSPKAFTSNEWRWPADQIQPLSSALIPRRTEAKLKGAAGLKLLTIRFDGAMDERPATPDSLKGKLYLAYPGDVVYSKIDLRNGAIGVVPPEFAAVAFTTEFPIYEIRSDVASPQYIQLLFRSEFFRATINGMVSGASGRKRVAPAQLEALGMPLPPLVTQQAIVAQWQQLQARIVEAEQIAVQCEEKARDVFLDELGLRKTIAAQHRKCFALKWSSIGRWGIETNQPDAKLDVSAGFYPLTTLSTAILDLANGWSPKCLDRPAEGNEWGVLKLGAVSYGAFDPAANKGLPSNLTPQPSLEIKPGDWLISRANITRLVGACALVGETPPRLMLCDKIFRAIWRPNSPVLPAYLDEVIKTPHLRQQIEASVTGTSPTMKNISKPALLALRFPLPPLDVQQTLITAIGQARADALALRQQAKQLREQAKREIEAALLGQTTTGIPTVPT